jgi:hypothetical protein
MESNVQWKKPPLKPQLNLIWFLRIGLAIVVGCTMWNRIDLSAVSTLIDNSRTPDTSADQKILADAKKLICSGGLKAEEGYYQITRRDR